MARPHSVRTLPTRDGVSPSCVALPVGPWATVLDFLAERLPTVPRLEWAARIHNGEVLDAQGHAVHAEQPYASGTRLFYYRHIADEPDLPVQERIVFQDDHLVVADKPHTGRAVCAPEFAGALEAPAGHRQLEPCAPH